MTAIKGTNLAAPVVPFDTADTYATHDEKYGLGGYRSVADQTARDAIPAGRRVEGMLVYSIADDITYQMKADLTTWGTFNAGGGGSGGRYDVVCYYPGKPDDGELIALVDFPISVKFPAGMANSRAAIATPPTATTVFSLQKNGTQFGTVSFPASGAPTITVSADTDFNAGDLFAVVNQSPADVTAAFPTFTFALTTL